MPAAPEPPEALTEVAMPNRRRRRAMGLRLPIYAEAMRSLPVQLPRSIRRAFRDPAKSKARVAKSRTRLNRALAPFGGKL
jgi:hypothetical protein